MKTDKQLPPKLVEEFTTYLMSKEGIETIQAQAKHYAQIAVDYTEEKTEAISYSVTNLRKQRDELFEALRRAYDDFKSSNWTEETYNVIEQLLKKHEDGK